MPRLILVWSAIYSIASIDTLDLNVTSIYGISADSNILFTISASSIDEIVRVGRYLGGLNCMLLIKYRSARIH